MARRSKKNGRRSSRPSAPKSVVSRQAEGGHLPLEVEENNGCAAPQDDATVTAPFTPPPPPDQDATAMVRSTPPPAMPEHDDHDATAPATVAARAMASCGEVDASTPSSPFSVEAGRMWRGNFPPGALPLSPGGGASSSDVATLGNGNHSSPGSAFQLNLDTEEAFAFVADGFLTLRPQHVSLGPEFASGAFARVRVGDFLGQRCAVKVQAVPVDAAEQANLLGELAVLRDYCHRCPRLVDYYGAVYLPYDDDDEPDLPVREGGSCGGGAGGGPGRVMMVMGLCEHGALREALRLDLPWSLRCRVISDVAEALQFLHGRGVLHRDVKSANVLLENGWRARLCDFNLAIADRSVTKLAYVAGTTEFMSPEMLLGDHYSFPADMFSLGITLWVAIMGREPSADFLARRPQDLFAVDLSELEANRPSGCPDSLWSLATDLTDPDPDVRPSAAASVDWLTDLLANEYNNQVEVSALEPVAHPASPTSPRGLSVRTGGAREGGVAPLRRTALKGREGKMVRGNRTSFRRRTINAMQPTDFRRVREWAEGLAGRRRAKPSRESKKGRSGTPGGRLSPASPGGMGATGATALQMAVQRLEEWQLGHSDDVEVSQSIGYSLEVRALADMDTPTHGDLRRRRRKSGDGAVAQGRELSPQRYHDAILSSLMNLPGSEGGEEVRRQIVALERRVSQDSVLVSRMQRVLERANCALREALGVGRGSSGDEFDREESEEGARVLAAASDGAGMDELGAAAAAGSTEASGTVVSASAVGVEEHEALREGVVYPQLPPALRADDVTTAVSQDEDSSSRGGQICSSSVRRLAAAEAEVREILQALHGDGRLSWFVRSYTGLCGGIADVLRRAQTAGEEGELLELRSAFVELLAEARVLLRRHSAPDGL